MWLFELLLRLYPAGFRAEYEREMRMAFAEEYGEASGMLGRGRVMLRVLVDFAVGWPALLLGEIGQDLQMGWRAWRRRGVLTLLGVVSLGMAIGISTGIFSVLNAALYGSLPYRNVQELVQLEMHSMPIFQEAQKVKAWKAKQDYLADAAAFTTAGMNLEAGGDRIRLKGAETTANFFALLGTKMHLGRGFASDEEEKGKNRVVVLSYGLFEQLFGGDPEVLGREIRLSGVPFRVIGVTEPAFRYPEDVGMWMPSGLDLDLVPKTETFTTSTIGRLKPGMSLATAQAFFRRAVEEAKDPSMIWAGAPPEAKLNAFREHLSGRVAAASKILLWLVLAVLGIACANMASLTVARYAERRRELAIRSFLGAGAGRIRQQILTECAGLGLVAGVLGVGVAWVVVRVSMLWGELPKSVDTTAVLDLRVLGFALSCALGCGVVLGVLPALAQGKFTLVRTPERMRQALLGVQVGCTLVVFSAALVLGQSMKDLYETPLGLQTKGLLTASLSMAGTGTRPLESDALARAKERLLQLPGVEDVTAMSFLPFTMNSIYNARQWMIPGQTKPTLALWMRVAPGSWKVLGSELLAGRDLREEDGVVAHPGVVISESFARQMGGVTAALGKQLEAPKRFREEGEAPTTVVGVVRDLKFNGPEGNGIPTFFGTLSRDNPALRVVVRGKNGMVPDAGIVAKTLREAMGAATVFEVEPMSDRLDRMLAKPRFYSSALGILGGFALLLTLVNAFSVAAGMVAERQKELAIRVALGATATAVRRVLGVRVAPALALGLAGGWWLNSVVQKLLPNLVSNAKPADEAVVAFEGMLLVACCAMALWICTRPVVRGNPAETLRAE